MLNSLRTTWHSPLLASLLANRTEGLVLAGVGGLQVGLHLLGLPGWACPFKATFGIPCPGCGLTAAIDELLHGKVLTALHTHAFAPIFLAAFALIVVAACLPQRFRQSLSMAIRRVEIRTGLTAWVLSALMLYWSIRLFGYL
jgi:hypothetical protein